MQIASLDEVRCQFRSADAAAGCPRGEGGSERGAGEHLGYGCRVISCFGMRWFSPGIGVGVELGEVEEVKHCGLVHCRNSTAQVAASPAVLTVPTQLSS